MGGLAYGLGYNLRKFGASVTANKIWRRILWADEDSVKHEDQLLKSSVAKISKKSPQDKKFGQIEEAK